MQFDKVADQILSSQVPLTALVADTVVRNLPCVPEGLEVVHVPTKMEDVAVTGQVGGVLVFVDLSVVYHLYLLIIVSYVWLNDY